MYNGWMIKNPDRDYIISSFSETKGECVAQFMTLQGNSWLSHRRQGFDCVDVEVEVY